MCVWVGDNTELGGEPYEVSVPTLINQSLVAKCEVGNGVVHPPYDFARLDCAFADYYFLVVAAKDLNERSKGYRDINRKVNVITSSIAIASCGARRLVGAACVELGTLTKLTQ